MSRHRPIKFEPIKNKSILDKIKYIIQTNKTAKTAVNVALALAATGGILTISAVAPNAAGVILKFFKQKRKNEQEKYARLWRAFYALKKRNDVEFIKEEKDGSLVYRLSNNGQMKMRKFIFEEITIARPKEWDDKWRLVIFDIPEQHKKARDALSRKLNELGFYKCQKSAWIHPFPCHEEIGFITDIFDIKPYVKIFLIEEMTDGRTFYYFKNIVKNSRQ